MRIAICGVELKTRMELARRLSEELVCPFLENRADEWIRSNFFKDVCPGKMPINMFFRMKEDILFDKIWKETNLPYFVADGTTIESAIEIVARCSCEINPKKPAQKSSLKNDVARFSKYALHHAEKIYDVIAFMLLDGNESNEQIASFGELSEILERYREKVYVIRSRKIEDQVDEILWHLGERTKLVASGKAFKELC